MQQVKNFEHLSRLFFEQVFTMFPVVELMYELVCFLLVCQAHERKQITDIAE